VAGQVVTLNDYRAKKRKSPMCWVTFIGRQFIDGKTEKVLRLTVQIEDGDFTKAIDGVRKDGGFYVDDSPLVTWFSPWPCAAIEIRHYEARDMPPHKPPVS
jgi:hypothetical protein